MDAKLNYWSLIVITIFFDVSDIIGPDRSNGVDVYVIVLILSGAVTEEVIIKRIEGNADILEI